MFSLKVLTSALTLALTITAAPSPIKVSSLDDVYAHPEFANAKAKRAGQQMVAIWTNHDLIVADLSGGSTATHGTGFNLFNDRSESVYSNSAPTGYIPCWGGRRQFTLQGGCLVNAKYKFYCEGDPFTGTAEVCAVKDGFDVRLAEGAGDDDVIFFAVGSGTEGYCAAVFSVAEGIDCGADGGLEAVEHTDSPVEAGTIPPCGAFGC